MNKDLRTIVDGQIYAPIKFLRIPTPLVRLWNQILREYLHLAYIHSQFLNNLNIRSSVIDVYPLHPQKKKLLSEPTKFKLQETSEPILSCYHNQNLGGIVIEECVGVSKDWFEEMNFPQETVDVIVKAALYQI